MKYLFLSTSLSFLALTIAPSFANTALPKDISDALSSAYQTQNTFVIQATKEKLSGLFPTYRSDIASFDGSTAPVAQALTTIADESQTQGQIIAEGQTPAQAVASIAPAAGEEETSPWSGTVEGGLSIATGNTEEETLNTEGELNYEVEHWKNTLKASARNEKSNDTRTAEDYRVDNQLNYKINERHYIFGEAGYVDDRFSGYDYRINEGLGYGYYFIKDEGLSLLGEIGGGGRHSKLINGDKTDELVGKISEEFDWDINDRLTFEQDASAEYGEDLTILNVSAGLKADIYKTLYLKLGFEVENLSDVPAGTKKTDTLTKVNLGYDF